MGILTAIPILGSIIDKGLGIVDKYVLDKDKAEELKTQIKAQVLSQDHSEFETLINKQAEVLVAEIEGKSWSQRNWRPHLMYLIMFLMVFNGCIVPIVGGFGIKLPTLEAWKSIPDQLWTVLEICLGGYIVGRSGEKVTQVVADAWKNKS